MGTYLIHPVYVDDLATTLVDCMAKETTFQEIFCIGGPEAVQNRTYYEIIAECLGTSLILEEIPLTGYLENHPEYAGHLCHRINDLSKLRSAGVRMPSTRLRDGIASTLK